VVARTATVMSGGVHAGLLWSEINVGAAKRAPPFRFAAPTFISDHNNPAWTPPDMTVAVLATTTTKTKRSLFVFSSSCLLALSRVVLRSLAFPVPEDAAAERD
jgi:hypothetical protein